MARHTKSKDAKASKLFDISGREIDVGFVFNLGKQRRATAPSVLRLLLKGTECLAWPDGTIVFSGVPKSSEVRVIPRVFLICGAAVTVAVSLVLSLGSSSPDTKPSQIPCVTPRVGELVSESNWKVLSQQQFGGLTLKSIGVPCSKQNYLVSVDTMTRKIVGVRSD